MENNLGKTADRGGGNMAYLSLYRKYRPQRFADVTGQTPVVRTLQNALERGRVAHAYMFSGPRGTGKTTLARLLAKGLNCENGPAREPCNECVNCGRINDGAAMDVIEIDGASNRGIDEIRYLRENVRTGSTEGGYKVYIIDEVHMLTTDAFNALLKTLEEPPQHVVFVLATTEAHKVPETIASRCQRFEFRNFTEEQLLARLGQVVESEGVKVSLEALRLIARHARGGMRDALGFLDQVLSFQSGHIEETHVAQLLGVVPAEQIWQLLDNLAVDGGVAAVAQIHRLLEEGADPAQLAKDCISFLRDLMLSKAQETQGVSTSDNTGTQSPEWRKFSYLSDITLSETLTLIDGFAEAVATMRWMSPPWLPLEMAIIRMTERGVKQDTDILEDTPKTAAPLQRDVSQNEAAGQQTEKQVQAANRMDLEISSIPEAQSKKQEKPAKDHGGLPTEERKPQKDAAAAGVDSSDGFSALLARWDQVAETLRQERNAPVEAFLREGAPAGIDSEGRLVLAFPQDKEFHKVSLEQSQNTEALERCLARVMGAAMGVVCCFEDEISKHVSRGIQQETDRRPGRKSIDEPQESSDGSTGNPTLDAAHRLFGGTIKEVSIDNGEEFLS